MRRTDLEFKAEVFRRAEDFRIRQRKRRKKLLATAVCFALCMTSLWTLASLGRGGSAKSEAAVVDMDVNYSIQDEAAEMEMKTESPASDSAAAVTGGTGDTILELNHEDSILIFGYLENGWIEAVPNCLYDFALLIDGRVLHYHSDCGTFTDPENFRSVTVTEEAKERINRIIENYS